MVWGVGLFIKFDFLDCVACASCRWYTLVGCLLQYAMYMWFGDLLRWVG